MITFSSKTAYPSAVTSSRSMLKFSAKQHEKHKKGSVAAPIQHSQNSNKSYIATLRIIEFGLSIFCLDWLISKKINTLEMQEYCKNLARLSKKDTLRFVRRNYTGRTDGKTIQQGHTACFEHFKNKSASQIEEEAKAEGYPEKYRQALRTFYHEAQTMKPTYVRESEYPYGIPPFPEIPKLPKLLK